MKKGILIQWAICFAAFLTLESSVVADTSLDKQIAIEKAKAINQINQNHEILKNSDEPTSFPVSHPSTGYVFDQWAWFDDDTFNVYIWRENGYLWMEVEPTSGHPFVCGSSLLIFQNDILYGTVKLEDIFGDSQCDDVYVTLVFWLTQYSFYDNLADLDQAFTLYYDGGLEIYSIDIPGSEEDSCGDYNGDGVVNNIDLMQKRNDLFSDFQTEFREWMDECWLPEMPAR